MTALRLLTLGMHRAVLLGCLIAIACPAAAQAAFPGSNGRILVQPNGAAAFTMNPDGSDHLAPAANFLSGVRGSLSPDGTREAYVDGSGVKVRDLASGIDTPIADASHAGLPVWSADGSQLAWQDGVTAIFRAPASGTGSVLPVAAPGAAEFFGRGITFTPDGAEIVVGINERGCAGACSSGHVVAIAVLTGARRDITPLPTLVDENEAGVKQVDVAGDGSRVVYLDDDSPPCPGDPCPPSTTAVESVPLSGGSATTLRVAGFNKVQLPRFAPDGSAVVYLELRGDARLEIRQVGSTGANNHVVDDANGAGYGSFDALQWLPIKDSDGDALPDSWETDGVDVDGDGTVDLDLPAMGADPDHKDVFVEIDAMAGHELEQSGIDTVVQAFGDAPVGNPDLVDGIALHVDNGPGSVMDPKTGETWGLLSQHETLPHQNVLGNNVGGPYDWTAFDALKTSHFSLDRGPAFHYVISAHRYGDAAEDSSGISRGIGAGDLIVSLGTCQPPGGADCTFTALDQAGTFMHELGHNLGLKHGGTDGDNNKANYLSIMNYDFQFTGLPKVDGTSVVDYSRFALASLDENALDENVGLGAAPGSVAAGFNTIMTCGATKVPIPVHRRAVDFDCNGVNDGVIATDINDDNHQTVLAGAEDWSRLVYDGGGAIGSLGAPTPPATTPLIEPPVSELLAAQAAIEAGIAAPPPTPAVVSPPVVAPPFVTPTTTGIAPAPPTPRPVTCSLKPSSSVALHGHQRNRLNVAARCGAAATLKLRASVRTTRRLHRKHRTTNVTLPAVRVHAKPNTATTIRLTLPRTVLNALTRGDKTSVTLTFQVTSAGGLRTTTTKIPRLTARRR